MAEVKDLLAQIAELQQQVTKKQNAEKKAVIKEIVQKMADYGITIEELTKKARRGAGAAAKSKAPAKYRLEDVMWSGFGRKPEKIKAYLQKGGALQDLEIK